METYENVLKEILKLKKEMEELNDSYKRTYAEYLSDILNTLNMYEKPVYCKQLEMRGMSELLGIRIPSF